MERQTTERSNRTEPDGWTLDERQPELDVRLMLLDGFQLRAGNRVVELSIGSQRLLAFLALLDRSLMRNYVAFTLWSDKSEKRAFGNLRSAIWRIREAGLGLIESSRTRLRLGRDVRVDLHDTVELANAVLSGQHPEDPTHARSILATGDLLLDWYDPWIVPERERLRQLRLHALEVLAEQLLERHNPSAAIDCALAAVAAEPMRESAHRILIKSHLAEGNQAEALRQYETYRYLASSELGVLPSPQMEGLVAPLRSQRGQSARNGAMPQQRRSITGGIR